MYARREAPSRTAAAANTRLMSGHLPGSMSGPCVNASYLPRNQRFAVEIRSKISHRWFVRLRRSIYGWRGAVLSAVLRTAVKWGHLQDNPARGVDLPKLRTVRPKWALTREQAAALLDGLPPLSRAMGGLAILSGLRRGELFALRWQDIDREARVLTVREAVYDGTFGTPKPRLDSVRFRCRNRL
jgi:integrase